ncbi:HU family DNA-binding protein, partial [Francisella tularensis]
VTLVGCGTCQVKERTPREGRNPKPGETSKIPASKVPSFKASTGLKDAVK